MRIARLVFCSISLLASSLIAETVDTDWCTIETPAVATSGVPIKVKITLKQVSGSVKICSDLHWMKKNGMFGGFLSYVPRQDARSGAIYTFTHTPRLTAEMGEISPMVFLSPDGDYNKKIRAQTGKAIKVFMDPVAVAAAAAEEKRRTPPATVTYKRSTLKISPAAGSYGPGEEFDVTVSYTLDASDNWADGTRIRLTALGPWIDNPDGTYTKDRHHVSYPGLDERTIDITPGTGARTFHYKAASTFRYNDLTWMATFIGGNGKPWPWSTRAGGPRLKAAPKGFDLSVERPGGLFTYGETVVVRLSWQKEAVAGQSRTVRIRLTDATGHEAGSLEQTLITGAPGSGMDLPLTNITARGVLLVEATIDDWGTREAFLARIPDVLAITGGNPTPFGGTDISDPEAARAARMLGLTYCRHFTGWAGLQPTRDTWSFEGLDQVVDMNVKEGLVPYILLIGPPAWVMPAGISGAGYEPFPFDADAWRQSITTIARHYKDRIWGFEWLNEIVPGHKSTEPSKDYYAFCRIGTEAVKAVSPNLHTQLAGGLWPRNFRTDLLALGVGQEIDVLPIHYGSISGIVEARQDLDAVSANRTTVWDNESAAGLSVWEMPAREALTRSSIQSQWVMQHWPDELVGGAEAIVYFGGQPNAAGNWTYLLDSHSPRPVAATLAVLASKLGLAKPVGKFYAGTDGVFHLFENKGRAILVAGATTEAGTTVSLPVGTAAVVQTDNQGNETRIEAPNGTVTLTLGSMPVFIEGADLDTLKTRVVLGIGDARVPVSVPGLVAAQSGNFTIPFRLRNPLDKPISGSVTMAVPDSWGSAEPVAFSLPAGASVRLQSLLKVAAGATAPAHADLMATVSFRSPALPSVQTPFTLTVVQSADLGNLLRNGDVEEAAKAGENAAASWGGHAKRTVADNGMGEQTHVLRFDGRGFWQNETQTLNLPAPGQGYLYTAWVWNHDMEAGSNMHLEKTDGTSQTLFVPQVFSAGNNTASWRLLARRGPVASNVRRICFQPVANGKGWAMFDNLRVTIDEGTDFAAEAYRTQKPPKLDGNLTDWNLSCPVPLLCDNQVNVFRTGYTWTPTNLAGIAYFNWDDQALYLAVRARDDRHVATTTDEKTLEGDSLCLALHPANRAPGTDSRASCWYISTASPGGGSGRWTLYRPPSRSGGLTSGQLAQNSSLYEMNIACSNDVTTYQVRIPWAEIGVTAPEVGTKIGLSLQLNDNDGDGRAAAITWGGGLQPSWAPSGLGVLTLIAPP